MLATITKEINGHEARFERQLNASVNTVWAYLTENDKLQQWFSELQVDELRVGGAMKFDMQDGTFEELEITDLQSLSILEYMWGEDRVRFELCPKSTGCELVLIEQIKDITAHTAKDLAGWHVCLDVIAALVEERAIESRELAWEQWYKQYKRITEML